MKFVYLSLRLCIAPLVALVIAAMAWYMWLQHEYLDVMSEFNA